MEIKVLYKADVDHLADIAVKFLQLERIIDIIGTFLGIFTCLLSFSTYDVLYDILWEFARFEHPSDLFTYTFFIFNISVFIYLIRLQNDNLSEMKYIRNRFPDNSIFDRIDKANIKFRFLNYQALKRIITSEYEEYIDNEAYMILMQELFYEQDKPPIQFVERKCFNCNSFLNFKHYLDENVLEKSVIDLFYILQSELVELFCCDCLNSSDNDDEEVNQV